MPYGRGKCRLDRLNPGNALALPVTWSLPSLPLVPLVNCIGSAVVLGLPPIEDDSLFLDIS